MLGTGNFIKSIIMMCLTIILFANIVLAFNMTNLGLPITVNDSIDFSTRYFGISDIIRSFQVFFSTNQLLEGYRYVLNNIYNIIIAVDFRDKLFAFTDVININTSGALNGLLSALGTLVNIFANIPWISTVVTYFFVFAIYLLMIVFSFVGYIFYILSGYFTSVLPQTEFPSVDDIMNGTLNILRFLPIY